MLTVIGQALFFFLPSYGANAAPVILNRLGWFESLKKPIDGGFQWRGADLFGRTKTWRGLIGGAAVGVCIVGIQILAYFIVPAIRDWYLLPYDSASFLFFGFLLGLGEGLGDLIKSFIKRRVLRESGTPFFPFDQMSFLGALALGSFYFIPKTEHLIALVLLSLIIPVIANIVAYWLGWKEVWY